MPLDFTNPQIADQYRQRAVSSGMDPNETEKYIKTRTTQQYASKYGYGTTGKINTPEETGTSSQDEIAAYKAGFLEPGKMSVESMAQLARLGEKPSLEIEGESTADKLSGMGDFEKKIFNARVAGKEALAELEKPDKVAGPLATRLQKVGEAFGKTTKGTAYRAKLASASSQLFNALAGASQSEAELKNLNRMMPKDTDSEQLAKTKLTTLLEMLEKQGAYYGLPSLDDGAGVQTSMGQSPTMSIGDAVAKMEADKEMAPKLNVSGQLAKAGDLIRNEDGGLQIMGEASEENMRRIGRAGLINNKLVQYLANSNFLPMAGGIAGGIAGSGMASIGTGAAGAMTGKAAQQYYKELLDPDAQDLSDHAKAIMTEGLTDAVMSGLTFGVMKGGSLVLKKMGSNAVKGLAKEGAEEVVEELGEGLLKTSGQEMLEGTGELGARGKLAKQKLSSAKLLTPSQSKKFGKFGVDFEEALVKGKVVPTSQKEAFESGTKILNQAKEKIDKMLVNKIANTDDVLKILEDTKSPFIKNQKVMPNAKEGVKKIDEWIDLVKSYGKEMPMKELDELQNGLAEAFPAGGWPSKSTQKMLTGASTKVNNFIRENIPEHKGANFEKFLGGTIMRNAEKFDPKEMGSFLKWSDMMLSFNPKLLAGKKGVELLETKFSKPVQAKLIVEGINFFKDRAIKGGTDLAKQESKSMIRSLLRLAQKTGMTIDISDDLAKGVSRGVATISKPILSPGLGESPSLDQPQQEAPTSPNLNLGQGGGYQKYLYK